MLCLPGREILVQLISPQNGKHIQTICSNDTHTRHKKKIKYKRVVDDNKHCALIKIHPLAFLLWFDCRLHLSIVIFTFRLVEKSKCSIVRFSAESQSSYILCYLFILFSFFFFKTPKIPFCTSFGCSIFFYYYQYWNRIEPNRRNDAKLTNEQWNFFSYSLLNENSFGFCIVTASNHFSFSLFFLFFSLSIFILVFSQHFCLNCTMYIVYGICFYCKVFDWNLFSFQTIKLYRIVQYIIVYRSIWKPRFCFVLYYFFYCWMRLNRC